MTGVTGEIFLIPIKYLEINSNITLKHLSIEFESNPPYIVQENNPHFKYIYNVYDFLLQKQRYILTLSIDRKLIFWKYDGSDVDSELFNVWDINFLGGKVTKLKISELEKSKVIMSCTDSTFRIWNLEKKVKKC